MNRSGTLLLLGLLTVSGRAFTLPDNARELVLGLADDWRGTTVTLQRYERQRGGQWLAIGGKISARGGRDGLAWGRGLHPLTMTGAVKREGDWKTPCGVFAIGGAYGFAARIQKHGSLPYHQITAGDLWVEDASSPHYNRFVALGRPANNTWERQQQMRLNDPAHRLKLFIAHNAPPRAQPGAGSAIFFHIWRADGAVPSAGCTTMSAADLKKLVAWIDPDWEPLYVLLPLTVYEQVKTAWQLP
ncbi:MAG: L,D-transpeptidase family protein [Verrucomicrobiales bacterium]|jgi:L,D-peptidoglycan transpeptidase YkuD (ErfK/YbiS/YcfS/YnhG family)|nr:L,D-transpeptidase family protein [Verrucomicrobiales bacterium]